jgi:hypothetical protein
MAWESRRTRLLASVAAGVALGVVYTASPLTFLTVAAFPLLLRRAGRGLPAAERQTIVTILTAALAARVLLIAALFVMGVPFHNDLSVGALRGDEAYNVTRSLRMRDVLLGMASSKYDHMVANDEYGRTSYLGVLTVVQTLLGPAPYGIKVFNAALFVAGAVLLFRLTRKSYGDWPAMAGLTILLFIPTLLYSSTSALKESLYFVAAAGCLGAAMSVWRAASLTPRVTAALVLAASVWLLSDLRRAGAELALAGLAAGVVMRMTFVSRWRTAAAALVAGAAIGVVVIQPTARNRVVSGLTETAKLHSGHVFTVGHAYKLLDDGFYYLPATPSASPLTLTPDHALRYVVRSAYTFALTPLPWEMRSRGELAVLPEQVLWYLLLAGLPAGIAVGWKRDALLTAMLVGYVVPTAVVVALTTGNVGTLVRLRGLVSPYLLWVSVLGYCAMMNWLLRARAVGTATTSPQLGDLTRATP